MKEYKKSKTSILFIILCALLSIYSACLLCSLFWALITSFKDVFEFDNNVLGFPQKWVFNYSTVFEKFFIEVDTLYATREVYLPEMFLNSLLYAGGCAVASTLTPCITAYLCAKFPYKFSRFINALVVVVMTIPIVGSQPAEIRMAMNLKMYDTIWGMWIMKANFLGMYYLVFYATFEMMPNGYREAAKIDGAGNVQILFHIILPLVKTTMITVGLLTFISYWNDYSIPLLYLPSFPTAAQGMYHFIQSNENDLSSVPMKITGSMLMLMPVLIVFISFHKRLMGNLSIGGLKG